MIRNFDYSKIPISERTQGMVDSSADYLQESKLFFYLMNARGRGYDKVNTKLDDLALQLSPLSATWGLIYWEESVGLPMSPDEPPEQRRPKVLARLQNYENFGAPMIHRIAAGFGEEIRVYIDVAECLVTVVFQRGVPTFLTDFQHAVNNIIHAHLGTEYKFEYNIYGGLVAVTRYHVYGYRVPEAGELVYCGTIPSISTEGRVYNADLGMDAEGYTVLRDYDQTGTIASGPLPFVSTEGLVYSTVIAETADGTITINTYKQSGEADTGVLPETTTEGRIYSAVVSAAGEYSETATRYAEAGELETGESAYD
ncbi:putative phage tail protein [uncultured Robinsoniella sp.]|uniref:putative phage tail protein n=1 Tax=uncultured Robinsoniella sp. TaxID=904190 RepID=UPI00374F66AF